MIRPLILSFLATAISQAETPEKWIQLFNGRNLKGLYTYLPSQGKNKDPLGVFKVEDGMIHVLGITAPAGDMEFGYFGTEKTYTHFHLRFQYKWAERKFAPRQEKLRDSGVLYHVTEDDKLWPRSVECQIQESDTGDVILIGGNISADTTVKDVNEKQKTFSSSGAPWLMTGGLMNAGEVADTLTGWNTVELIVKGDTSQHIVNGKLVAELKNIKAPSTGTAYAGGRIVFQAEGAELFYRNIEIAPLVP